MTVVTLSPDHLKPRFEAGLDYAKYVETGKPAERENWARFHQNVSLTPAQATLLGSFTRRMHVLCLSGTWCGDCVQQCPMFDHIARANPERIALRFVDRDKHIDLSNAVRICGGNRVPTVLFLNEDYEFVSILGDRVLARYRALASRQLGPSCPLPGAPVPADEVAATLQHWIDEFERVHLLLRLSAKLRERHND